MLLLAGIVIFVYGSETERTIHSGIGFLQCGWHYALSAFEESFLHRLPDENGHMPLTTNMLDIGKNLSSNPTEGRAADCQFLAVEQISTLLRGLKHSPQLSAIITVADDGGGSGVLRRNLGMLPPGDIRNCVLALADTEPQMEKLLQYRFQEGDLKGQSFGNLFLAAMTGISDDFETAVRNMSQVLAVTGTVLPVTSEDINLIAELEDGKTIQGESRIGTHNTFHPGRIKRVYLDKNNVKPLESALCAIDNASVIILGPGSLYTSIIPNLLVDHVAERIVKSSAVKIYVANVMTQPGETEGYSVYDHIRAIYQHAGTQGFIDYCIVNTQSVPDEIYKRYQRDGASMVRLDAGKIKKLGIKIIERDLLQINQGYVRHDPIKLMNAVAEVCNCVKKGREGAMFLKIILEVSGTGNQREWLNKRYR